MQLKEESEGVSEQTKIDARAENKVFKPDQGSDKIPPKQPNLDNIDNDFRPVILSLWQDLCQNYKLQTKKIFS